MVCAIAKLITGMGMFIHDLRELKIGNDETYTEQAYYSLAEDIMRG